MTWIEWYNSLSKPSWTPAPATIGLIWQLLYPIILVSFGFVFVQTLRGKTPWLVALPFAINLAANVIFTPIQFGLRNLPLASVDILVVWASGPPSRSGSTTAGLLWLRRPTSSGCRLRPYCN